MNLLSKIALSGKFGKSIYLISGVLTVAMCSLVLLEPVAAAACFFIKLISIPIIFYLYTSLSDKAVMYFIPLFLPGGSLMCILYSYSKIVSSIRGISSIWGEV